MQFKYLFEALLKDESVIKQNQEDKSATTKGKNCFYDVMQNMDNLVAFGMFNQEKDESYAVDLTTGRFVVNGASFFVHDEPLSNIRLIYFKRNFITLNLLENQEVRDATYHFGFQANLPNGSNFQRVMVLH